MRSPGVRREKRHLFTVEQRRNAMGYTFILPWVIGVSWFFLYPFFRSIFFIFNDVNITKPDESKFVGLEVIKDVYFVDAENIRIILESIRTTFVNAVLIVAFSLIVAMLLNKPFRGRGFCRAMVALPIIVSSGVLMQMFKEDLFRSSIEMSAQSTIFQGAVLENSLLSAGLSTGIVSSLTGIISNILDLIWQSGIQILLFIGAMQAIPRTYMEVCEVEGASSWQSFWRVTFPMISPFILLNMIYAIIDSFVMSSNPVINKINGFFQINKYSKASTLSFGYFLVVLLIVGIASAIISRKVFYIEK